MEDSDTRNSFNHEPSMWRPEHSSSAGQNQSGRYGPRFQTQNIRYARYRENLSDGQYRQYNQHPTSWELQAASLQMWRHSLLNPNADSYSPERTTNNSLDWNVQSEIFHQENFRQSM
jgi:hypothetical protein